MSEDTAGKREAWDWRWQPQRRKGVIVTSTGRPLSAQADYNRKGLGLKIIFSLGTRACQMLCPSVFHCERLWRTGAVSELR